MSKIFISYRRSDSQDVTGRIYDALVARFSEKNVFKDVNCIPHGEDFRKVLQAELDEADVVIVIIGPRWADITNARGERRLDDPDDFVRIEIEIAISAGIPIIPVIVSNGEMVTPDQLPQAIRKLAFLHGLPVRPDPDFRQDVGRLVQAINQICRNLANDKRFRKPSETAPKSDSTGLLVVLAVILISVSTCAILAGCAFCGFLQG